MYDAFTSQPVNAGPYDVQTPIYPRLRRNPSTAANRALTRGYHFFHIDRVPQAVFDRILWITVRGGWLAPPPPGPNATPSQ